MDLGSSGGRARNGALGRSKQRGAPRIVDVEQPIAVRLPARNVGRLAQNSSEQLRD